MMHSVSDALARHRDVDVAARGARVGAELVRQVGALLRGGVIDALHLRQDLDSGAAYDVESGAWVLAELAEALSLAMEWGLPMRGKEGWVSETDLMQRRRR